MIFFALWMAGAAAFGQPVPAVETARAALSVEYRCRGCGCKGGPGWRVHRSGRCASSRNLAFECGSPPSERLCTYEKGGLPGGFSTGAARPAPAPRADGRASGGLVGRATVIDADTIEIQGQRIRLWGIDAPEGMQLCKDAGGRDYRCGQIGANALARFLDEAQPIRCHGRDTDKYGRMVADCENAFGQDVGGWLVQNGHALDWPFRGQSHYPAQQEAAKARRAGIWQGSFEEPWVWRRQHPR